MNMITIALLILLLICTICLLSKDIRRNTFAIGFIGMIMIINIIVLTIRISLLFI